MKEGWEEKKLGDIGRIFSGNSINRKVKERKYLNLENGLPYLATKDIGYNTVIDYNNGVKIPFVERDSFKIALKHTALICAEGGSAGRKIGFTNQDVCFGNKLFAIKTNSNVINKYVFYWYFSPAFQKQFKTSLTGLIGGVSQKKFREITIPIPPLPKQKRIVALLDETFATLDKAKANAERNLINAREVFESTLDDVFKKQSSDLTQKSLVDLCEDSRIITYGVIKLGNHISDGVPCLRTSNVRWLRIETDGMKRILPSLSEQYSRTILKGGEILVNVRGTLGGVAVVPSEMAGWNVSREVAVVPIDRKKIDTKFISYFIASGISQKWFGGVQKGAAYVGINIKDLRLLPVSVPPFSEQHTIVAKLDALSAETKQLEGIYERKLAALEELRRSVLQKAFAGEL